MHANIASNKNQQYKSAIIVLISVMKRFTHFYFHAWSVILHWLHFDGCIKKNKQTKFCFVFCIQEVTSFSKTCKILFQWICVWGISLFCPSCASVETCSQLIKEMRCQVNINGLFEANKNTVMTLRRWFNTIINNIATQIISLSRSSLILPF